MNRFLRRELIVKTLAFLIFYFLRPFLQVLLPLLLKPLAERAAKQIVDWLLRLLR